MRLGNGEQSTNWESAKACIAYSEERVRVAARSAAHNPTMATAGKLVFGIAGLGIGTGFVLAGVWSIDQLKETDNRANKMISPSAPPLPPHGPPPPMHPPSPMLPPPPPSTPPPPTERRSLEEGAVFKFTEAEEKKIVNEVRGSILGLTKKKL